MVYWFPYPAKLPALPASPTLPGCPAEPGLVQELLSAAWQGKLLQQVQQQVTKKLPMTLSNSMLFS